MLWCCEMAKLRGFGASEAVSVHAIYSCCDPVVKHWVRLHNSFLKALWWNYNKPFSLGAAHPRHYLLGCKLKLSCLRKHVGSLLTRMCSGYGTGLCHVGQFTVYSWGRDGKGEVTQCIKLEILSKTVIPNMGYRCQAGMVLTGVLWCFKINSGKGLFKSLDDGCKLHYTKMKYCLSISLQP